MNLFVNLLIRRRSFLLYLPSLSSTIFSNNTDYSPIISKKVMIKKYFFTLFPKNQVPIIRHSDIVTSRGGGENERTEWKEEGSVRQIASDR